MVVSNENHFLDTAKQRYLMHQPKLTVRPLAGVRYKLGSSWLQTVSTS
jgi:hypothetical protein